MLPCARVSDEPRNSDLEQIIRDDVDDDAGFAVLADWLGDHPRGKLAALQARGLVHEADALLEAHPALWGGLERNFVTDVTWRHGFIDACKVAHTRERY